MGGHLVFPLPRDITKWPFNFSTWFSRYQRTHLDDHLDLPFRRKDIIFFPECLIYYLNFITRRPLGSPPPKGQHFFSLIIYLLIYFLQLSGHLSLPLSRKNVSLKQELGGPIFLLIQR